MKKLIALVMATMLTGCICPVQPPVTLPFPKVPQELMDACPDLKTTDPDTEKLSEVLPVIVANYGQYYECKIKVDAWIEWYNSQRSISEAIK